MVAPSPAFGNMGSGGGEGEPGNSRDEMSKITDSDTTEPTGSAGGEDGGKNKISGETPPAQDQSETVETFTSYQPQLAAYYHESPSQSASGGYDLHAVLLQQQTGSAQFARQYPAGIPPLPLSPAVASTNTALGGNAVGVIPPASPIFPAVAGVIEHLESPVGGHRPPNNHGDPSTGPSYVQQNLPAGIPLYGGMQYHGYGGAGIGYANPGDTVSPPLSPDQRALSERASFAQGQQHIFAAPTGSPSPQLHPQGMFRSGVGRSANLNHRSPSFEDMLPPSALDPDRSQSTYSPYAAAQLSPQPSAAGIGADFYPQPSWCYSPGGYSGSAQEQQYQPRLAQAHVMHGGRIPRQSPHSPGGHRGLHGGMPYYAATTPGPPIQTTASNKGPDGANLFIFHIPNHFTNLDMFNLFCHYGNLISVRIMVEKDTGRSRGFGFVSYDKPEAAAMAIKELNGFVIGNKRLKVQHKQIKSSDTPPMHQQQHQGRQRHNQQPYSSAQYEESLIDDEGMLRNHLGMPSSVSEDVALQSNPQWYNVDESAQHPPDVSDLAEGTTSSNPVSPDKSSGGSNPVSEDILRHPSDIADVDNGATSRTSDHDSDANQCRQSSGTLMENSNGISGNSSVSPLINLEPLRSALPDVSK